MLYQSAPIADKGCGNALDLIKRPKLFTELPFLFDKRNLPLLCVPVNFSYSKLCANTFRCVFYEQKVLLLALVHMINITESWSVGPIINHPST